MTRPIILGMGEHIITAEEVAAHVQLPVDWLKAEARAGRLPHLKIGRRLYFNLAAVENSLLQRAAASPANDDSSDERASAPEQGSKP